MIDFYLIFARKAYPQPLECIGALKLAVDAPKAELDQRAREQFGAEGWVEMVAIPDKSIVRVIPLEADRVPGRA